jgi:hypothetical protein
MNPKRLVLVLALLAELGAKEMPSNAAEPRDAKPVAQEPTPFLRDIKVGYLMNYNFLSPRPYCWPKADALLSGWEVGIVPGTAYIAMGSENW